MQIKQSMVRCMKHASSWEEAVRAAAKPMVEAGMVEKSYVDSMVQTVHDLGTYIVVAPDVALPHARPDQTVHQAGFAILRLDEPVFFGENGEGRARLVIPLACKDGDSHLEMIATLADMLGNPETVAGILEAKDEEEICQWVAGKRP